MLQAYLKKNKLGKYNEEEMAALAKEKEEREAAETKMVGVDEIMVEEGMLILIWLQCCAFPLIWLQVEEKGIVEGARAEIVIQGSGKRRGTVRYIHWLGQTSQQVFVNAPL